ncbi:MAG TPA: hypothetical protein VGO80_04930 [Solirubrobacteraceae bacterium]|jgi:cation diffusion facilitator CzcD-associated flavoprotein CzcO|nr:hypothetical protein [Solirubrobacteraceae bacterium]
MSQLPTVAIIGAGSSGITAVKALQEREIALDRCEAFDRIGSSWAFANENSISAADRDLHINRSRDRMAFSDSPKLPVPARAGRDERPVAA